MKKILITIDEAHLKLLDQIAEKYNEYTGTKPNRSRATRIAITHFWSTQKK